MDRTIILIFPPYWPDIDVPYGALPYLTGHLMAHGYDVKQYDFNISCFNKMLENHEFHTLPEKQLTAQKYHNYFYNMDLQSLKALYHEIQNMYSTDSIFNTTCGELEQYIERMDITGAINSLKCQNILTEIFYENNIFEDIEKYPVLIGLSVQTAEQFIIACFYSKLLRTISTRFKIVFGGGYITNRIKNINENCMENIFDYCDYLIYSFGETALERLAAYCIENNENISLDKIPNLIYRGKDGRVVTTYSYFENMNSLHPPEYIGVNFRDYLMPEGMITYTSSYGCHWGRCAFCRGGLKEGKNYREKDPVKVVRELVYLRNKYGIKNVQFTDAAHKPEYFEALVNEMDRNPDFKDIEWMSYTKLYPHSKELMEKAKANGCKMLLMGIETLNERLSKLICKGIDAHNITQILAMYKQYGIRLHIWLIVGLPSQTEEDLYEEIEQLESLYGIVDFFSAGKFMLFKDTRMYADYKSYNIVNVDEQPYAGKSRYLQFNHTSHKDGVLVNADNINKIYNEEYAPLASALSKGANRYMTYSINEEQIKNRNGILEKYKRGVEKLLEQNESYVVYGLTYDAYHFIESLRIFKFKINIRAMDLGKEGLFARMPIEKPNEKSLSGANVIVFCRSFKNVKTTLEGLGAKQVIDHNELLMQNR